MVIILPGLASSIKEWSAVIRGCSPFIRTLLYDRSGFGESDVSPYAPTAEQTALELDTMLNRANIEPPYILVCHSYGGIIAREFIDRRHEAVAGVVFVDANTEETPTTFPNAAVQSMQRGLNTLVVTTGNRHALLAEEWTALLADEADPRNAIAGQREAALYHFSGQGLRYKRQTDLQPPLLGDAPIVILHANYALDLQRIYDAGERASNGTIAERETMVKLISEANGLEDRMQRQMLRLSTRVSWQHVSDSGHYIHIVRPEIVVEAVLDVLTKAIPRID